MKNLTYLIVILSFVACASLDLQKRRFLDSTSHDDSPPDWVKEAKITWESKEKVFIRATHSVKGNERINGCFDLAKLDSKENILSEISNEVKGSIDNAQQSISEDAEVVLGKVRASEFHGRILGLRFTDQYFERYLIGEIERIDCHTLSEIKRTDYDRIKKEVIDRVVAADPKIKEAITKKQIEFFGSGINPELIKQE